MMAAVLDHLWQSTLFACAAGLLAVALRRHSARARYWTWFAASVKFLIPFSLLESAGSWLEPRADAPLLSQPVTDTVNWIATPFVAAVAPASGSVMVPVAATGTSAPIAATHIASPLLAAIAPWLAAAWLAGSMVVLAAWAVKWMRLLGVVRSARTADMDAPFPVRVTTARIEPGIVGLSRPVLLLPEGLAAHLSPEETRCLIAHEVSHLRRRDNLTAAIHMLVEAVFWFYPLTWWLETRLVAERERACDESVLASGHDAEAYAEGILKVCRFFVQAPLACTAGVSGADLKKRIEAIMSRRVVHRMSSAARLAIVLAGIAGVAAPMLYGFVSRPAIGAPTPGRISAAPATASSPQSPTSTQTSMAQSSTPAPSQAELARRKYEQSRPQKEVPFNPPDFDKYAGYYQFANGGNFAHVYRTGSHYYLQLLGQPSVEIFPESSTEFFATLVAAQFRFTTGPDGRATGMVIHQSGLLIPLRRVSQTEFDSAGAALAKRIKDNKPSPGTRAMVLSYIKDLAQGRPQNYDTMSPDLAAAARQQFPQAEAIIRREGQFKSLAFASVAPNGADIYIATFSNGKLLWVIMPLSPQGKVTTLFFRPYPP